jgi:Lon protease-like protein
MTDIAVFPIPNCVTFPGTVFPLHVFEPRFRTLIHDCIDASLPLAVCHADKVLHEAKPDQAIEERLQSNQATYKPVKIVSAGECELLKTLDDGRLMVNVHLKHRYTLLNEQQTLPYSIFQAERFDDQPLNESELTEIAELKDKLLHRLIALTIHQPLVQEMLLSDEWQNKVPEQFSFEIFSVLQTDADVMQGILESQSPMLRLQSALAMLNDIPAQL